MSGSSVCVRNFDQRRDYASGLVLVFLSMRSHNLQIGSIVSRRGLRFAPPVERLRKIKLGIRLTGFDSDGALPAIHGLIAVPPTLRQKSVIHQCIGVPRPMAKNLLYCAYASASRPASIKPRAYAS